MVAISRRMGAQAIELGYPTKGRRKDRGDPDCGRGGRRKDQGKNGGSDSRTLVLAPETDPSDVCSPLPDLPVETDHLG